MMLPHILLRRGLEVVGRIVWMVGDMAGEMAEQIGRRRPPFRLRHFLTQTDRTGVGSVPLVALVSCFLGLTMALLTGYQLHPYGQERLVPNLVAVAFSRELGPLLTGIVVAARIGAAYTAELGTMKVSDEVEALEAMGLGPLRYLVSPRLIALVCLMPSLVVVSNLAALTGGALVSAWALDISLRTFGADALGSLLMRDVISGLLKGVLFGLMIALIACYQGLNVRGGAAGVGEATTSSVVLSVTLVIGCDTLFNVVLVVLFPT